MVTGDAAELPIRHERSAPKHLVERPQRAAATGLMPATQIEVVRMPVIAEGCVTDEAVAGARGVRAGGEQAASGRIRLGVGVGGRAQGRRRDVGGAHPHAGHDCSLGGHETVGGDDGDHGEQRNLPAAGTHGASPCTIHARPAIVTAPVNPREQSSLVGHGLLIVAATVEAKGQYSGPEIVVRNCPSSPPEGPQKKNVRFFASRTFWSRMILRRAILNEPFTRRSTSSRLPTSTSVSVSTRLR